MPWRFTNPAPTPTVVTKQVTPDFERLRRISDTLEPGFVDAFLGAVLDFADSRSVGRIRNALDRGNIAAVLAALDVRQLTEAVTTALGEQWRDALLEGAELAERRLPPGLDFDMSGFEVSQRVLNILFDERARLADEIGNETQDGITAAIGRALRADFITPDPARDIVQSIGLTVRQEQAVANFRRGVLQALEQGNSLDDFFGRASVRQPQSVGRGRALQLVDEYRERLKRDRAENIARTETTRALARGRHATWQELADRGAINTEQDLVEWLTTPDDRACPICLPMHGQTVQLGEAFTTGEGGSVEFPPAHPRCRCDTRVLTVERQAAGRTAGRERTDERISELRAA